MTQQIVKRYREAFKQQVVSEYETRDNLNDLQKKKVFSARTRILVAYVLFNVGLLLPVFIFNVSDAVIVQLNLEVAVLFSLWAIFAGRLGKRGLRLFAAGFGLFYVVALVYKSYASALLGLYQMEANFFNDYSFVLGEMSFFLDALNLSWWVYLAGGTAIIVLVGLIFWGARITIEGVSISVLGRPTRFGLIALGLIAILVGSLFPKQTADLRMPVSSVTAETAENIHRSLETREYIKTLATIDPTDSYDYAQYSLSETPDVFFIFVESYGSVVYKRQHFTAPYLEMLDELEQSLADNNWSVVSTLSEAPIWGGGSWMSYTSALFGLLIDQQSEYVALKEKYSVLEYPNIGRFFSSQGYDYVWVASINRQQIEEREENDHRFYGADRWITFDTLNYEGPLFGWGPSAPDQFTFGFIQDFVLQSEQPAFLVYLTQNSHYPWTPLPPVLDDWRELEKLEIQDGVLSEAEKKGLSLGESRQNYLKALDNTLDSLEEFIKLLEKENSVIVLIGDHQPPTVSRHTDGYGTMVHIISQDVDLLASFQEYGFVNGLVLENLEPTIRHEGIYSLFVRNFIAQYGKSPSKLPPYLPNGHQ
ncbi:MAG: sulfatase-like hydrolase/transferase [Chloroflexota bacterium]|nr:MAG: sulfatase-like hydrolase/transferase [Chloroflexota bacterium]